MAQEGTLSLRCIPLTVAWVCVLLPLSAEASVPCPNEVTRMIAAADLSDDEADSLFSRIAERPDLDCQVASVAMVAERIDARTHPAVFSDFTSSVATYARFLSPDAKRAVREAYLRISYDPDFHFAYFLGLREAGIDVRGHVRGAVPEDWAFTHPRRDAASWHYHLYLASLGEEGSYRALAGKLRAVQNGNDLTNLLTSLAQLETERSRQILMEYAHDPRTADTPEGSGAAVSETVQRLLVRR